MSSTSKRAIDEVRRNYGEWTMHNIRLRDGSHTMEPGPCGHDPLARSFSQHIRDVLRRPFAELRVADLGCLEGLYALELAAQGVREAVGIEIRAQSVAKAEFVRRDLGLQNCRFVEDDARNFTAANYGRFDAVLCLGLLYHLDAPDIFHLLRNIRQCCDGMLILDTHVSLFPNKKVTFEGHDYWGWESPEHGAEEPDARKQSRVWASLGNDKSFWLTRASLFNFLDRAGYTSTFEVSTPALLNRDSDRITVVALPGERVPYGLREAPAEEFVRAYAENDPKFFADAEHWRLKEQHSSMEYLQHVLAERALRLEAEAREEADAKAAGTPPLLRRQPNQRPVGPECPLPAAL